MAIFKKPDRNLVKCKWRWEIYCVLCELNIIHVCYTQLDLCRCGGNPKLFRGKKRLFLATNILLYECYRVSNEQNGTKFFFGKMKIQIRLIAIQWQTKGSVQGRNNAKQHQTTLCTETENEIILPYDSFTTSIAMVSEPQ